MAEKRKEKRGRILGSGESQRHDFTYQYRYKDIRGKWLYAPTLEELRANDAVIPKDVNDGIGYCAGEVTVIELAERYIAQKQGVRYNIKVGYCFVLNLIKREDFVTAR